MFRQITIMLAAMAMILTGGCITGGNRPVSESGLAVNLEFKEGQGEVVNNNCDPAHPGRLEGWVVWDKAGGKNAIDLNGEDVWVDLGAANAITMRDSLTAEVWVYPRFNPYGDRIIVGYENTDKGGFCLYAWTIGASNDHEWYVLLGNQKGQQSSLGTGKKINLEQWQFVVFRYDQGCLELYLNGDLVAAKKTEDLLEPSADKAMHLVIGKNGDKLFFNGKMGEIRIYNRPLSKAEIQRHFTEEAGKYGHKQMSAPSKAGARQPDNPAQPKANHRVGTGQR